MHIAIDLTTTPPTIELLEPDAFNAFDVVARGAADGASSEQLASALERIGTRIDDDHAAIDVNALKGLAGARAHDRGWLAKLDGMVAFAARHGWVMADGSVRAHIERLD
jgi:hypothetical protein